jgi:site-specific recombinase XerC
VGEVAGLQTEDVALNAGEIIVLGKGRKQRTVYLIDHTVELLVTWLEVREAVALLGISVLFVVIGLKGTGPALGARGIRYLVDQHLTDLGLKA